MISHRDNSVHKAESPNPVIQIKSIYAYIMMIRPISPQKHIKPFHADKKIVRQLVIINWVTLQFGSLP